MIESDTAAQHQLLLCLASVPFDACLAFVYFYFDGLDRRSCAVELSAVLSRSVSVPAVDRLLAKARAAIQSGFKEAA